MSFVNKWAFSKKILSGVLAVCAVTTVAGCAVPRSDESLSPQETRALMNGFSSKLEIDKSWISKLGVLQGGKLYCESTPLKEGTYKGDAGVFTWVVCVGMHRETTTDGKIFAGACTAVGAPAWVQYTGNVIDYKVFSLGSEVIGFRASMPQSVQRSLNTAYKELTPSLQGIILARATRDLANGNLGGNLEKCGSLFPSGTT